MGALARAFAPVVSSFRLKNHTTCAYILYKSLARGGGKKKGKDESGPGCIEELKRNDDDLHEEAVLVAPVLVEVAPFPLLPVLLLRLVPLLVDATATFCP